jgi:hypothetical protein
MKPIQSGYPHAQRMARPIAGAWARLYVVNSLPRRLMDAAMFQDDVLTAGQLLDGGLTRDTLRSQVDQGNWQRLYRGVYATFSGPPTRSAQLWAAVLAAGPGAMLSHESAAETRRLTDKPAHTIHVTIPWGRRIAPIPGLTLHLSSRTEQALDTVWLPPQTRIEETVLDLASVSARLDDAVAWVTRALGRRLTTQENLRQALGLRKCIRWHRELDELLSADSAGLHSILEYRYDHDVERPHGLPAGERQARFSQDGRTGYRDRLYEAHRVAVELDGRATHPVEDRWLDIRRDNAAAADGIVTLRYGWLDVTRHPCLVAAEVALALAKRGYAGARPCSPKCPVGRVTAAARDRRPSA